VARARVLIVGAGVVFVATMFLPWFREVLPDNTIRTANAFQAGWTWALAIIVSVGCFVGVAFRAISSDARSLPFAGACAAATAALVLTRCWINIDTSIDGATVDRRWGLFVALNALPLFAIALRSTDDALLRRLMPPASERDHGYGI
jgi:hypothetical protein